MAIIPDLTLRDHDSIRGCDGAALRWQLLQSSAVQLAMLLSNGSLMRTS